MRSQEDACLTGACSGHLRANTPYTFQDQILVRGSQYAKQDLDTSLGQCLQTRQSSFQKVSPDMCCRQGLILAGQKELPVFQLVLLLLRQVSLNCRLRFFLSFFYTNKVQRIRYYNS